ncbi:MAG TPA: hypothetical protein VJ044_09310 [Candidatus Hodarchaeales archaeon]|nr:hypothetical protein [Candidatus Hodarchaeales archaeon]
MSEIQTVQYFCPNCATLYPSNLRDEYTCHSCNESFKVVQPFLMASSSGPPTTIFERAARIASGKSAGSNNQNYAQRSYERFRSDSQKGSAELRIESSFSDLISDGVQVWIDSLRVMLVVALLFGSVIGLLKYADSVLETDMILAENLRIAFVPQNLETFGFTLWILSILFLPLFDPLRWLEIFFRTSGLVLTVIIIQRIVFTGDTAKGSNGLIISWIKLFPKTIFLTVFMGGLELVLDVGSRSLELLPIVWPNEGTVFIVHAFVVYVAFPFWILVQILLLLIIPSTCLSGGGVVSSVKYAEVLVRSRWQKAFKLLFTKSVLILMMQYILILAFMMLGVYDAFDFFYPAFEKDPLFLVFFSFLRFLVLTIILSSLTIMYFELHSKRAAEKSL